VPVSHLRPRGKLPGRSRRLPGLPGPGQRGRGRRGLVRRRGAGRRPRAAARWRWRRPSAGRSGGWGRRRLRLAPCGYSAVIQPASSHIQQQNKPCHASGRNLAIRSPGRRLSAPSDLTHSSETKGRSALCRGPVRGPSHPCKRCDQRHRRHETVPSVQLARLERQARLLIIRRSWVRAPPAPPASPERLSRPPAADPDGGPADSRAGNVMCLLNVGGRAYAGRNGDLQESC